MSSLHQWFNQSKILLLTMAVMWSAYIPTSHAAEITAIDSGSLEYIDKNGNKPISAGSKVPDNGSIQAGPKGAKFRYQCKKGKPSKSPKVLKSNRIIKVMEFCPPSPSGGIGED